jgi:hypothetical protein
MPQFFKLYLKSLSADRKNLMSEWLKANDPAGCELEILDMLEEGTKNAA